MKKYFLFTVIALSTAITAYAKESTSMSPIYSADTFICQINLDKFEMYKPEPFKNPARFSYVVEIHLRNHDSTATATTISMNSDIRELSGIQESTCDIPTAVLIQSLLREYNAGSNGIVVVVKEVLTENDQYEIAEAVCYLKIYQGNGRFILTPSHRLK